MTATSSHRQEAKGSPAVAPLKPGSTVLSIGDITGTTTRIKELGVEEGAARLQVAARRVSSQLGSHDRFTAY